MTQAQTGMQECLVVFARSVEVLYKPSKARAIEVRSAVLTSLQDGDIFLRTTAINPSKNAFMGAPLGWLKIPDLRIGSRLVRSPTLHQWDMIPPLQPRSTTMLDQVNATPTPHKRLPGTRAS